MINSVESTVNYDILKLYCKAVTKLVSLRQVVTLIFAPCFEDV